MNPLMMPILDIAGKVFDRLFPDPQQKAQAQFELIKLQQEGALKQLEADLEMSKGQMEANIEEAKNPSLFVSGWRPAIGWVCAAGFLYQYLGRPIAIAFGVSDLPTLDGSLMELTLGMLGLGGLRTLEKFGKVASK